MDMHSDEIPMCNSCGHRHIQGVKCSVCGHVGKSQIFVKMKSKANEKRNVRMDLLSGSQIAAEESKFDVIYELRKLLATEGQAGLDQEFNLALEQNSFHMIGFLGDLPVSVVRYRIEGTCVTIDRLGVLHEYRHRNIAHWLLFNVVKHALQHNVTKITAVVRANSWLSAKLLSCQFVSDSVESEELTSLEIVVLHFSSVSHSNELLTFLQSKVIK